MVKKLKSMIKKIRINRTTVLAVFFLVLAGILIQKLFSLQIIQGEEFRDNFSLQTTRERTLNSTRGSIFDRNGNVLASNELSYSLTIEDTGNYENNRAKHLALNGEAYLIIKTLEANGDTVNHDFHVVLDEAGNYTYNVSGTSLARFRADVYGHALIENLKPEEKEATAEQMMETLTGQKRFSLTREEKPYSQEELSGVGLPAELTREEILKIVTIRYALSTTSYQRYVPVTVATDISQKSVASISENKDKLEGVEVVEDTKRVYQDSMYFAPLIGYTGKASAEELTALKEVKAGYTPTSIVGKAGIEKVMEPSLQGSNGSETVHVDIMGKVLEIDDDSRMEPLAGNDVYLTIDKELQIAAYKILEQRLAGVLLSVIIDTKEFDKTAVNDASQIRIPIYDVYNALISNSIVDTTHFSAADASPAEQMLLAAYGQKQTEVFAQIQAQLTGDSPTAYKDLSKEMKEYMTYIVDDMLMEDTGILEKSAIDSSDSMYLAWTKEESISLKEYLTYAASQNWIDISEISDDETYLDSGQVYSSLSQYITDYLSTSRSFSKLLYKYLLHEDRISGTQICQILYDQKVLSVDDGDYEAFISGGMNSYNLILNKIRNLEITPAQLALEPCSGSAVVTDPNNGDILACVTYPGYDNNRLANDMDVSYYQKIYNDMSRPLYNKATQQTTAPGSTFKLVTATAGMGERVINEGTVFNCSGVFDLTETPLNCWNSDGHGDLAVTEAIKESCNVFFCNVAYQLGVDEEGNFRDSLALQKLQNYAEIFDMDKPSGIEISEVDPQVSDSFGIQSSIGQGTHLYTTTQLARYVSTLANKGTSYNISLLEKTADAGGNLVEEFSPEILSKLDVQDNAWNVIHTGMRNVITNKAEFSDFKIEVSGKTGTAQESKTSPDHAVFVCYAPSSSPKISMAIRVANGYSSTNAVLVGKDILRYHFDLADEAEILTGKASEDGVTSVQTD